VGIFADATTAKYGFTRVGYLRDRA
jgi:hypothetical protein